LSQYAKSAQDKRLTVKPNQRLVFAHAAGTSSGQDKAGGLGPSRGGCGFSFHISQVKGLSDES
jgi:hypothetical protein